MPLKETIRRFAGAKPWPAWRLAGALVVLELFAYFALMTAVWGVVRYRNGFTEARWTDFAVLPFHWQSHRQQQARWSIERGLRLFEAGKVRASIPLLHAGLVRRPAEIEARLALARALAIGRRPDQTETILLAGVPYAGDQPEYLRAVLAFLFSRQEDDKALALCRQELTTRSDLSLPAKSIFQLGAATACFFRGHFDAAEDWLRSAELSQDPTARVLRAQIEWERGYRELAIAMLGHLVADQPALPDAYDLLAKYLLAERRFQEVRRLSLEQQIAAPTQVRPRVDFVFACEALGETGPAEVEAVIALNDFAGDAAGAAALADYAAQQGNVTLARSLVRRRKALQLDAIPARFALAEAWSKAHQYRLAQKELLDLGRERTLTQGQAALLAGLQAVVAAGLGDVSAVQLHLAAFLNHPALRAENVVAVAVRLQEQGSADHARAALESALRLDPLNQAALMHLIELDLARSNLNALPASLRRYVQTRRPSPPLLQAAQSALGRDSFLFSPDRTPILNLLLSATPARTPTPGQNSLQLL